MAYMPEGKTKRTWEYDEKLVDMFDVWTASIGMQKNVAASLALWVVMRLDPATRQEHLDAMRKALSTGSPADDAAMGADFGRAIAGGVDAGMKAAGERGRRTRRTRKAKRDEA